MRENMMTKADKDLLLAFIDTACGRVLKKTEWKFPTIPQGVTVINVHENGMVEYLFTKAEKYPVVLDDSSVCGIQVGYYANGEAGLYLYLNSCMIPIASKHRQYAY